jgi:hypothetical protein
MAFNLNGFNFNQSVVDSQSGSELFLRKQQVVRIGATLAKLKTWRGV